VTGPVISVIVPARDAAATLQRTLAALANQGFDGEFETIVVDDASSDSTLAVVRDAGVEEVPANGEGPARARNAGVERSGAPLLAFLDADCEPAAQWLSAGCRALDDADLVQGRVAPDPAVSLGPFDRTLSVSSEGGLYEAANLFVRRDLFERLGGFESWLGPRAGKELGEDVLFGWRARRAGARTAFCEAALVHHAVFPRGPAAFVAERWRLRFFPAMAGRMPELRRARFFARFFHTRRSAAFDAAVLSASVAASARKPAVLAGALPYACVVARESRYWGKRRLPLVALAGVAADVVGFAALAAGSVRARSPLL
jgi:glycosyltransferase involved in cell wall biosynthesis